MYIHSTHDTSYKTDTQGTTKHVRLSEMSDLAYIHNNHK